MALKSVVENLDDVDEVFKGEYKEVKDDKGAVTGYALDIEGGIENHPAAKTLKAELGRRRISEKNATTELAKLAPFKALGSPEEVQAKLDRIPELEALADGKLDDAKINNIVEGRVKNKLAPLEREVGQLKTQVAEKDKLIGDYTQKEIRTKVNGSLLKAAKDAKVTESAMEDIELYGERVFELTEDGAVVTKEGVGATPGLSPKEWLIDMQSKRPHWWGPTAGGGAGGSRGGAGGAGSNPWSAEHWNMTEQGRIVREKGRETAERMAKAAGTSIGALKPPAKKAA